MTTPDSTPIPPCALPMASPRMSRGACWSDIAREIQLDETERQARLANQPPIETRKAAAAARPPLPLSSIPLADIVIEEAEPLPPARRAGPSPAGGRHD